GRELRAIKRGDAPAQNAARVIFGTAVVQQLRFAPDGKTLYALHQQENAVTAWDVETGKEVRRVAPEGQSGIAGLGLTADGKTLVTAENDGLVRVWETSSGRQQRQFGDPGVQTLFAGLSP